DLLLGKTPIAIGGGPGMGKTTIAVNALFDAAIREKFSDRRIFVPLDAAREPHAILTALASAIGLPATGGDSQLLAVIGNACSKFSTAVILDNADTPYAAAATETERILHLLGQVEGLSLIVTARGTPPIFGQKTEISNINSLTDDAARDAFL